LRRCTGTWAHSTPSRRRYGHVAFDPNVDKLYLRCVMHRQTWASLQLTGPGGCTLHCMPAQQGLRGAVQGPGHVQPHPNAGMIVWCVWATYASLQPHWPGRQTPQQSSLSICCLSFASCLHRDLGALPHAYTEVLRSKSLGRCTAFNPIQTQVRQLGSPTYFLRHCLTQTWECFHAAYLIISVARRCTGTWEHSTPSRRRYDNVVINPPHQDAASAAASAHALCLVCT
jgi:hypothetical protein